MYKIIFIIILFYYKLLSVVIVVFLKKSPKKNSVLYLPSFFKENAGFHWRVKKWEEELTQYGFEVKIASVFKKFEFETLLGDNYDLFLLKSLHRRFWQVVASRKYERIIVRRELLLYNDYGNMFLELFLLKIHPNAILDFDDDLSAAKEQPKKVTNIWARLMLEHGDKFNESLKKYNYFIVASEYLKDRIISQNPTISSKNIEVIPTCVDYNNHEPKKYKNHIKNLLFGWVGNPNNYFLLDQLLPIFEDLYKKYDFKLLVVSKGEYSRDVSFPIEFKEWSLENEVEDIRRIDIGLMPLDTTKISKGKGGFKLIQYMGLGIVSIASSITVNKDIVDDTVDSFLLDNIDDWKPLMVEILEKKYNLELLGNSAQNKIANKFSFSANKERYISFVKSV